ncbi:MAG: ABC transporter ATP-binding protein [Candidatus Asgardarchaeum sp.]
MSNSEHSVEIINVHKVYKVGEIKVHALRGANLKVRRGEFIAIMGPSGSGKSTLLNLIGALDKPTEGKVIIDGIDISTLNNDQLAKFRNEKIGFIFQNFNLINRSKVIRNIELPAIIKGMPKRERMKRALELLKALGLEGLHNRRPKHLSGGQQQRVAIARALINSPQIILADEPTGNLDSVSGREVMSYLRMMNEKFGTTVIVVTHDREVGEMADRIVHIKDGMIIGEEIIRREKYEKNN